MNRSEIVMLTLAILSIVLMFVMIITERPRIFGPLAVICAAVAASMAIPRESQAPFVVAPLRERESISPKEETMTDTKAGVPTESRRRNELYLAADAANKFLNTVGLDPSERRKQRNDVIRLLTNALHNYDQPAPDALAHSSFAASSSLLPVRPTRSFETLYIHILKQAIQSDPPHDKFCVEVTTDFYAGRKCNCWIGRAKEALANAAKQ